LIQKEEYLSLAINKYIGQTKSIPKKDDKSLDWDKLMVEDYLGVNFNKKNPFTNSDIIVKFDDNNNCFITGVLELESKYNMEFNYLYNFYTNKVFRVNTLPPQSIAKDKLLIGSQVLYRKLQEDIRKKIKDGDIINSDSESCTQNSYFYELRNQELIYKYCKGTYSFDVYQESPVYLENWEDLPFIKAKIGDTAYVQKNGEWYEYYYQGRVGTPWFPVSTGEKFTNQEDETVSYEEKISTYIPNAKDLLIRQSGGCMLSNGDIYCWGNNSNKKVGISSFGQIDNSLSPDFINTPVMLKTQIDNIKIGTTTYDLKTKNWYNNPYRVKFEKMAMNSTNVCGITKIFEYTEGANTYKIGGDLYCNGSINRTYYEDLADNITPSPILRRNDAIYTNKETKIKNINAKYLVDIAMIEDTTAVLTDDGKIYTLGKNYKGALGIDKNYYIQSVLIGNDDYYVAQEPALVSVATSIVFKKIFALRDTRTFGAIDSNNLFYIWGERGTSIYNKPTLLSSTTFNPDAIFVNTNEFILRDLNKNYYKTTGTLGLQSINSSALSGEPISISYYKDNNNKEYLLYIDENLKLHNSTLSTSSLLSCKEPNETIDCDTNSKKVFDDSINYLNTTNNNVSDKFANFTNVSVFKLDHQIEERYEDFEDKTKDWVRIHNGGTASTRFLGRFANEINSNKTDFVNKTFDFGIENAGKAITIKFDFYEIDSWDGESFNVYVNGNTVFTKQHWIDSYYWLTSDGGTSLTINDTYGWGNEEKHQVTISATLDSNGKVRLGFSSTLDGNIKDESWGVDNIQIVRNSDNFQLIKEDFEGKVVGWNCGLTTFNGGTVGTNFLGRYSFDVDLVEKTFDYGIENANKAITINFNFYEIDTWDSEYFRIYINGNLNQEQRYSYGTANNGGTSIAIEGTLSYSDEKHSKSISTTLDANGRIKLGFSSTLDEDVSNESWGVDNIKITRSSDNKILENSDFEMVSGWILKTYSDGNYINLISTSTIVPTDIATETSSADVNIRIDPTRILGRFEIGNKSIEKTYNFGSAYANFEVDVEFDFYEIDTWDTEKFQIFVNNTMIREDRFVHNNHPHYTDTNDTGIFTLNFGALYTSNVHYNDEKYTYKFRANLNSSGQLVLKLRGMILSTSESNYGPALGLQGLDDESWGIDNVRIKLKETNKKFVCAMTGVETASQMYCWGNVARSIPILSTSLYDVSKISTINKLFISQDGEKTNQMSYDEFFNDGKLYLKYPTYIGGFDYPFYFR
jgi:hypothetical protein